MSKHIYVVCLRRGRSHPEHHIFFKNVNDLGAKSPDYGGINKMCLIGHHLDIESIHSLCSSGIEDPYDVTVEEITRETLNSNSSHHVIHTEIIENYFLPHGKYPNIE